VFGTELRAVSRTSIYGTNRHDGKDSKSRSLFSTFQALVSSPIWLSKLIYPTWMTRWRLARWRLNQTGKLSVREIYHDPENDDHASIPDIYSTHKTTVCAVC
jgi:hypothetical protein